MHLTNLKNWFWDCYYNLRPTTSILPLLYDDNTSTKVLDIIFKRQKHHYYICAAIAQHPNASPEVLDEISYGKFNDSELTYFNVIAVAGNPNTSSSTLKRLATNPSYSVRKAVYFNPSTTEDIQLLMKANRTIWNVFV